MRYDSDYKARSHERILAEAARTLRIRGSAGIGVASVMADAGLTHGAFYAHFDSKEALVDETVQEMIFQARGRFDSVVGDLAPNDAIRAYLDFYLSPRHRDTTQRSCPLPWLAAEVARMGTPARERYGVAVAGLTDIVATRLRALGNSEPEAAAASVVAELVGAVSIARAVEDVGQSDLILARSKQSILARLQLSGPSRGA